MTETVEKRSTGTAQVVWGAILLVAAIVGIVQMPGTLEAETATMLGGIIGTLVFAGLGAFLLVLGLNKRRTNRAS